MSILDHERVLVFSAHAADFCSRAGGTIARFIDVGSSVHIVDFSYGELCESPALWARDPAPRSAERTPTDYAIAVALDGESGTVSANAAECAGCANAARRHNTPSSCVNFCSKNWRLSVLSSARSMSASTPWRPKSFPSYVGFSSPLPRFRKYSPTRSQLLRMDGPVSFRSSTCGVPCSSP